MKIFFKSMWYGMKASYTENRRLIIALFSAFSSILISVGIARLLTNNDGIVLLIVIPSFILGMYLCFSYLHYKDATDYAKKHNVSFETAWNNTKPDDEDCF